MAAAILNNSLILATTEEIAEHVLQPDVLADHEYLDTGRRNNHLAPEKNFIFAMLEDAVRCYQASAFGKSPMSRRQFRDAEKWLWENDWQWIFSVRNICEVFGLDPFCLRRGLLVGKKRPRELRVLRSQGIVFPGDAPREGVR
jgi:hypothetical protein